MLLENNKYGPWVSNPKDCYVCSDCGGVVVSLSCLDGSPAREEGWLADLIREEWITNAGNPALCYKDGVCTEAIGYHHEWRHGSWS